MWGRQSEILPKKKKNVFSLGRRGGAWEKSQFHDIFSPKLKDINILWDLIIFFKSEKQICSLCFWNRILIATATV